MRVGNSGRILLIFCGLLDIGYGLKILMYQIAFSPSHMPFSGAIADVLTDAGHVVDKVISVINPAVKSNGSTRLRNVYRIERKNEDNPYLKMSRFTDPFSVASNPRHNPHYIETRKIFCEDLLNNDELVQKLRAEKYDVMLVASYDYCGLGLHHALQIPPVSAYTATQSEEFVPKYLGFPRLASFVTFIFEQKVYQKQLTFMQRLRNLLVAADHHFWDEGTGIDEYAFLRQKFPEIPTPAQLYMRLSYVFRNTNEILRDPRPESNKVKYIGGIAINRTKIDLTEEVAEILDRPSKGAVVFSFGSLFSTKVIKRKTKIEILKAFDYFRDYTFIWKFDKSDPDLDLLANYTHVFPIEWLPQVPLLNDKRLKLFISHFGVNSYQEVAHAGKPAIGIPIFSDQPHNVGCAVRKGFALHVEKTNLTTEALRHAINEVLTNPSYALKAQEISAMLRDRPLSAQEELIQSVEYSAKHPQLFDILQLASADMGLVEYYCLDVIFVIFLGLIAAIWSLIYFVSCVVQLLYFTRKIKLKEA